MATVAPLSIELIGHTEFTAPAGMDWETDATGGSALVEFAGRACYETFDKPNPRTNTNSAFINHLKEVGHMAVFEHATATFYIRGLSHTGAHELMRHRHLSFSQLSPRYVAEPDINIVLPEVIAENPELSRIFLRAMDDAQFMYEELKTALADAIKAEGSELRHNTLIEEKRIRQAAREVLPHAQETRLVVSGNYRGWRHFIAARGAEHVNREVRIIAVEVLKELKKLAPACFDDFDINQLNDGSEIAVSPYAAE
ncbi:MAG: FAD-dependent thymidylate synthase [Corynebacterium sp.]|nr:FAD-dependent thymidylate synthase [Corynebacterium sp.]